MPRSFCASLVSVYLLHFFNYLRRTLFRTLAASDTFLIIDMGHIVLHLDGSVLTLLRAETAADTSGAADFLDSRTAVMAGAAHRIGCGIRHQLDQVTGAGRYTFAAGPAFFPVYGSDTVIYCNGAEGTCMSTGTETDTSKITGPG